VKVGVRYEADTIVCLECDHKWLGYIHVDVIDWGNGLVEESRSDRFECPNCGMYEGIIYEDKG
jgi:hypothetical protein